MMRNDSESYKGFGEIYFSFTNPGVVKGWKKHTKMVQNFAVPVGEIKLVVFDDREDSPSKGSVKEMMLSPDNYNLVTVPNNLWYSFKATSNVPGMIANCSTIPHDPEETMGRPLEDERIPYRWP